MTEPFSLERIPNSTPSPGRTANVIFKNNMNATISVSNKAGEIQFTVEPLKSHEQQGVDLGYVFIAETSDNIPVRFNGLWYYRVSYIEQQQEVQIGKRERGTISSCLAFVSGQPSTIFVQFIFTKANN